MYLSQILNSILPTCFSTQKQTISKGSSVIIVSWFLFSNAIKGCVMKGSKAPCLSSLLKNLKFAFPLSIQIFRFPHLMNFFTYLSRNALKTLVFTLVSYCSCLIKPPVKSLCTGWTKSLDKNSLQSLPRNQNNLNTNFGG